MKLLPQKSAAEVGSFLECELSVRRWWCWWGDELFARHWLARRLRNWGVSVMLLRLAAEEMKICRRTTACCVSSFCTIRYC